MWTAKNFYYFDIDFMKESFTDPKFQIKFEWKQQYFVESVLFSH